MARYNEILVGHFARYLQKFTGIKGAVPTPTLAPEIFPIVGVFSGSENRYLSAWNVWSTFATVPAAAGFNGGVQLRNPVASNILAVVFRISFRVGIANTLVSLSNAQAPFPNSTDLGSIQTAFRPIDARAGATLSNSNCVFSSQNNPSVGTLGSVLCIPSGNNALQDYEIILPDDIYGVPLLPGDILRLSVNTANVLMYANYWWRERFLEESERT